MGTGEYGDELRSMLFTFGAAKTVNVDVLRRLEDIALLFVTQLRDRLAKEVEAAETQKEAAKKEAATAAKKMTEARDDAAEERLQARPEGGESRAKRMHMRSK
jgi:hypothetical protein